MGNIRAKNVELERANTELQERIDELSVKLGLEIKESKEETSRLENNNTSLKKRMGELNEEILKLSDTIRITFKNIFTCTCNMYITIFVRKQIEERMELQQTVENMKNPAENEVILLPIASRIKAASLPVNIINRDTVCMIIILANRSFKTSGEIGMGITGDHCRRRRPSEILFCPRSQTKSSAKEK